MRELPARKRRRRSRGRTRTCVLADIMQGLALGWQSLDAFDDDALLVTARFSGSLAPEAIERRGQDESLAPGSRRGHYLKPFTDREVVFTPLDAPCSALLLKVLTMHVLPVLKTAVAFPLAGGEGFGHLVEGSCLDI